MLPGHFAVGFAAKKSHRAFRWAQRSWPPGVTAIGVAGNLSWLFIFRGYWVDRHGSYVDG